MPDPHAPVGNLVRRLLRRPLSRAWMTVIVLGGYAILTVVMTWPLALHFADTLPDGSDGWQEMWGLWWFKKALVDLHTTPFYTNYLYYPNGIRLYFHPLQPFNGLISIPFQVLGAGLPAVYNILILLSFVLAGYGMYLLVRHLTGAGAPAFIAGCVYAFCPYHFAHMLGQLNLASLQWMPFYLFALFKAWGGPGPFPAVDNSRGERRQLGCALLAGLLLVVNAYTEWLYAALMGLFTLWFFAWQLTFGRAKGSGADPTKTRYAGWRPGAVELAVQGGVCIVLLAPVLIPMIRETQTATYMRPSAYEVELFSADLTDIAVPNLLVPLWNTLLSPILTAHYMSHYPSERLVFVGYIVLLLVVVGIWRLRRLPGVLFWGWTALGAWVLSLGPVLHVWGSSDLFGVRIPLPYAWFQGLPGMSILRTPGRISVLIILALAVLVGYSLSTLFNRQSSESSPERQKSLTGLKYAAIGALILLEFIPVPFPLMPQNYEIELYHRIAHETGNFAVLELPIRPIAIFMAYQTIHRRPMIGGYVSRLPPDSYIEHSPLLTYLLPSTGADDPVSSEASSTGLDELRRIGVRYVIVHWQWMAPEEAESMHAKLARVIPNVIAQDVQEENITFYKIGP